MPTKKILVVFGATGAQGGSVIESILGDVQAAQLFALRAVTRDPDSANAKQLAAKGVECVEVGSNSFGSVPAKIVGQDSLGRST